MQLTGNLAEFVQYCIEATTFVSLGIGLFVIWSFLFDLFLTKVLGYFRIYAILVEFIFDRARYKRKLKEENNDNQ